MLELFLGVLLASAALAARGPAAAMGGFGGGHIGDREHADDHNHQEVDEPARIGCPAVERVHRQHDLMVMGRTYPATALPSSSDRMSVAPPNG